MVKNPLSPVEHPGGVGVNCEMFEAGLDQFVVSPPSPFEFVRRVRRIDYST